jgi:hypothetical protein
MNNLLIPSRVAATSAIPGFNEAVASRNAIWPTHQQIYSTSQITPTFSFFDDSLAITVSTTANDFTREISSIFASLCEGQEPLGAEFEAVWDANLNNLYQS